MIDGIPVTDPSIFPKRTLLNLSRIGVLTNKHGGIASIMMRMSQVVFRYYWGDEHSAASNNCTSSNRIQGRRQGTVGVQRMSGRSLAHASTHCNLEMHKIPPVAEIASSNSMNKRNAGTTFTALARHRACQIFRQHQIF